MARAGDVIENPRSGERIAFEQTGAETNGQYLARTMHLAPRGVGPPEHVHPIIEERFEVVSGTLTARIAGTQATFAPGQAFVVAPGAPHRWWNDTDEEVVIKYRVSPALPLDQFLENVFALVQLGHSDRKGLPGPLRLSRVLPRFWHVVYLASPPLLIQKATMAILGLIARVLTYPSEYPYPYERAPGS